MTLVQIAIDTGGTFTDLVARVGQRVHRLKVPSTPDDPGRAVLDALRALGHAGPVRHGTTVATNALLERRLARVILVTNEGLGDVLHLRRQARPWLYALHPRTPEPIVADRVEVRGRRGPAGELVEPLEDLSAWIERERAVLSSAEAFAVGLLHSYVDAADERAVAEALSEAFPNTPVIESAALAPVFREYERLATAAVDAALTPVMGPYLGALATELASLSVMGSAGGLMSVEEATAHPVHTVLSGPAGGVVGAWTVGRRCGRERLLSVDMGGTSTDVSVLTGALAPEDTGALGEHPLRVPLLPIETVGAGGGSIAFVDAGGALRVGPRSAGAVPGPACYGRGGQEATVTDANLVLGRIEHLLGGDFEVDAQAARRAVGRLAETLGASLEDTAKGILRVAEANMARACKRVSMERGVDPRGLALLAFGGAGGLHACSLAEALGCPEVIFPAEPGVLSAEGILAAARQVSETRSLFWGGEWAVEALASEWMGLEARLRARLPEGISLRAFGDCRYAGQTFTLAVPMSAPDPAALRRDFVAAHAERYGYALERPVELVALRLYLEGPAPAAAPPATPLGVPVLGPHRVSGYSATLWLPEGWSAQRLSSGDLLCRPTAAPTRATAGAEPLALEVHRQQLAAIAEEMGATLMRAAFSANIKERRDFSCAVFDARGRMLVHAAHIPVHLGSTPLSVQAAMEAVELQPGVQVLLNDPFCGGTHLPDVTLVTPVFEGDTLVYLLANRAHHADIGGISPGSLPSPRRPDGSVRALSIDDEGFRLAPTVLDGELRRRLAEASRTPAERWGDLRAQEAANRVGAEALTAWSSAHGRAATRALDDALLDYAERRMRALVAALPDGDFTCVEHLDDDGTNALPIPIPVTLRVRGEAVEVDFREAPDMVDGPMNAVRAIALSAVFYCFRCLAGEGLPANEGLMRPIRVLTRPGSIVDALPPAAVSAGNVETSQRLVDAVFGALAQATDRVPAPSCGSMNNVLFGGEGWVHYETLAGGAGGGPEGPGASGIHTHMTNTLNTPIEALERAYPVRIERYALAPAGAEGPHRGGAGVERVYRFLAPAEVTLVCERRRAPARGLNGAADAPMGLNEHLVGSERRPLPGKVSLKVAAGEAIAVRTPGGASWRAPQSSRQSSGISAAPKE